MCTVVAFSFSGPLRLGEPLQDNEPRKFVAALGQEDWRNAADHLAACGDAAVDDLSRVLRDRSFDKRIIQSRAIDILVRIGTVRAMEAIVDCLNDQECNEHARGFAALGLSEFQSDRVLEALGTTLRDKTPLVRWKSAEALGKLGLSQAAAPLARALTDEDEHVRAAAARALGQSKPENLPNEIIEALKDDSWIVRSNARNAVLEIGWPASRPLVDALTHNNNRVRWQAAWALGKLDATEVSAKLVGLLNDPDWIIRDEAAVALTRIKSESATDLLIDLVNNTRHVGRREAIWVLSKLRTEKALQPLKGWLTDNEMEIREWAAEAIRRIEKTLITNTDHHASVASTVQCDLSKLPLYPQTLEALPRIHSPCTGNDGREFVTVTISDKHALFPVTVENGTPLDYRQMSWGKGNQLRVNAADFPTLARSGLHSELELDWTKTITDRSVGLITELGRPGRSSGVGFVGHNEDIISVLKGDNRVVKRLGQTHPQLARPLFHVWNMILAQNARELRSNSVRLMYNGNTVFIKWEGSRGWQESLFRDEILGMYQIDIRRAMSERETELLKTAYPNHTQDQMEELVEKLSTIHTGEMVPYYINRYGFYEGHTDYRADPIAIAFIFGLKDLAEIEKAFPGQLHQVLTADFSRQLDRQ